MIDPTIPLIELHRHLDGGGTGHSGSGDNDGSGGGYGVPGGGTHGGSAYVESQIEKLFLGSGGGGDQCQWHAVKPAGKEPYPAVGHPPSRSTLEGQI